MAVAKSGGLSVPIMDWDSTDRAETFKLFKQRLEIYFTVQKTKTEEKVPIILLATGDEGLRRFNSWNLSDENSKKPDVVFKSFLEQLEPTENIRVCRLKLNMYRQQPTESIDTFVNRCNLLAKKCEFSDGEKKERILELIIASTPIPEYQRELLSQPMTYTLNDAITLGRKYEAAAAHSAELSNLQPNNQPDLQNNQPQSVSAIKKRSFKPKKRHQKQKTPSVCKNCGGNHDYGKENCPAKDAICFNCERKGHWSKLCMSKGKHFKNMDTSKPKVKSGPHKTMNKIDNIDLDSDQEIKFYAIEKHGKKQRLTKPRDEAFVTLSVKIPSLKGSHSFVLKVDTGAQANTMPYRTFGQMFPDSVDHNGTPFKNALDLCEHKLHAYNNTNIECMGTTRIKLRFGDGRWVETLFYVVNVPGPAVLGLPSCEELKVVTLHCSLDITSKPINNIGDLMSLFPDQFDKIGCFPMEQKLVVNKSVQPTIDRPRRVPIAIKSKIKAELDSMEKNGVIRRIEKPTDWVSSLTYTTKKNGSIRLCLDPRSLNRALKRPHHQSPTVDEINYKLRNAKFFTKLDAKWGYWSVKLAPESQELTTFQTPFSRYCFQRLPFGLNVSQDLFQLQMDRIIQQCSGVCGIADDIIVFGDNEQSHDNNLINFMKIAKENGLSLNSQKCDVKRTSISFFGNIYTSNGIKPDPCKIRDLQEMATPTDKAELQHFLGFATYLSRFVPNFSSKTAVLRELLQKDSIFVWEAHHNKAFEDIKTALTECTLLQYYDPHKPVFIHTDASLKGLGAAILQRDENMHLRPVEYTSKSLTATEQRYSCIERELLAIVFAVHRFHTYLYGRSFNVVTDHKPLVSILDKPLTAAPPRLQRMLTKLQGYQINISYQKGSDNSLADGLSRFPNAKNNEPIDLDIRVDFVHFTPNRLNELQTASLADPILNALRETIIIGWPDNSKDLPLDIRPFWNFRDILSVNDGLILKGQQIVIPKTLQPNILEQLHTAHMGAEKTKLLARDAVYWININRDIDEFIHKCSICQTLRKSQQKEPLECHDIPTKPWSILGVDIFDLHSEQWLIIADYYSKFPVLRKLPQPAPCSTVVQLMKSVFSEYGIPDRVVSDNGPHFSGSAFKEFSNDWQFQHVTSSPRRPQGNGFVERQIQTVKQTLNKAKLSGTDPLLAMVYLRSTPISSNVPSPAFLLMGRKIRSDLLCKISNSQSNADDILDALEKRKQSQKLNYDKGALKSDLPPLYSGQQIRVQDPTSKRWEPAVVNAKTHDTRSYIVKDKNGKLIRRNRQHIMQIPQSSVPKKLSEKDLTVCKTHTPNDVPVGNQNPTPAVTESRYGRVIKPVVKMNC